MFEVYKIQLLCAKYITVLVWRLPFIVCVCVRVCTHTRAPTLIYEIRVADRGRREWKIKIFGFKLCLETSSCMDILLCLCIAAAAYGLHDDDDG